MPRPDRSHTRAEIVFFPLSLAIYPASSYAFDLLGRWENTSADDFPTPSAVSQPRVLLSF